jgi:hypothetical protein
LSCAVKDSVSASASPQIYRVCRAVLSYDDQRARRAQIDEAANDGRTAWIRGCEGGTSARNGGRMRASRPVLLPEVP